MIFVNFNGAPLLAFLLLGDNLLNKVFHVAHVLESWPKIIQLINSPIMIDRGEKCILTCSGAIHSSFGKTALLALTPTAFASRYIRSW